MLPSGECGRARDELRRKARGHVIRAASRPASPQTTRTTTHATTSTSTPAASNASFLSFFFLPSFLPSFFLLGLFPPPLHTWLSYPVSLFDLPYYPVLLSILAFYSLSPSLSLSLSFSCVCVFVRLILFDYLSLSLSPSLYTEYCPSYSSVFFTLSNDQLLSRFWFVCGGFSS